MSALVCGIFFLSGASALIFETLWFHQAALAVGNSVWASSLVLAGFMGGLALGNAIAARAGDRLRRPLRIYAAVEVAIAATGVPLVLLLPEFGTWLAPLLGPLLDNPWVLNPLRLLIAFLLLLVPSTAMGVTLPLLTRALAASGASFGRVLGTLYGWNTLGAVAGVLTAEFLWIGALGIRGSAFAAGALNLGVALAALGIAARFEKPLGDSESVVPWRAGSRWLVAAFVSGFVLLALEVVWFRLLSLFVHSRSESFAVMLCVVLTGIAGGGLVASFWLRRLGTPARALAPLALVAGAACAVSYAVLPSVMAPIGANLVKGAWDVAWIAAPLILPVSFLSGLFFTVAGAALRADLPADAATAGALTLANTLGAAIGALAGGFVLLPLIGVEWSLFALSLVYASVGIALGIRGTTSRRALGGGVVVCGLALGFFPFGSMRNHHLQIPQARWMTSPEERVAAVREGTSATLVYIEQRFLGIPRAHQLLVNSIRMSTTDFWSRRFMKLYAYWPVAVRPETRSALLICYGLGSTTKALVDSEGIEEIDVVDTSPGVLSMSELVYPEPGENPLQDPRVRVHIEDGRYFLKTTERHYDLITGDPPPPGAAGVVNLYTREYFQSMRDRLNEGGIVTYWLPLHSLSEVGARAVLRSFCDVFDDCSLWHGMAESLVMIGTRNLREGPSLEAFARQWSDPKVGPELRRLGFEKPEQLGALFIGDARYVQSVLDDSAPLVDDRPKLVSAPSRFDDEPPIFREWRDTDAARTRFETSPLIEKLWPESLRERTIPYFDVQRHIHEAAYNRRADLSDAIEDLHAVLTESSVRQPVLWLLGTDGDHLRLLSSLTPSNPDHPLIRFHLGAGRLADRDYAGAAKAFEGALRRPQDGRIRSEVGLYSTFRRGLRQPPIRRAAFRMRVYSQSMAGDLEGARETFAKWFGPIERRGDEAPFWVWMRDRFGVGPPA